MRAEEILKWSFQGACVPGQTWKCDLVVMLRVIPVGKDAYYSYNMAPKPKKLFQLVLNWRGSSFLLQRGKKWAVLYLLRGPVIHNG